MQMHKNTLFPVFLKLEKLVTVIVGGGYVGHEKLQALLKNNPYARVQVIAPKISRKLESMANKHSHVQLIYKSFAPTDLDGGVDLVIVATDNAQENAKIRYAAKSRGLLVNVADTPDLCDFYLGSTVTKGDLKVGISTNGKSPTFAKRFRQLLEEVLPDQTDELLQNLNKIRKQLKGNFQYKVNRLNELTAGLLDIKDN